MGQVQSLKDTLQKYESASGQTVNNAKTDVVFSNGVPIERRNQIGLCLDIREVLSHENI